MCCSEICKRTALCNPLLAPSLNNSPSSSVEHYTASNQSQPLPAIIMKIFSKLLFLSAVLTCSFSVKSAELLLYVDKGSDHVFLGCFTCSRYDSNSIWNTYGNFGSQYSSKSIWNRYGNFGSEYSSYSPWNAYASKSPVLDKNGNFYGYFTCNKYRSKRVSAEVMDFLCENVDRIRDDSGYFYEKYMRQ